MFSYEKGCPIEPRSKDIKFDSYSYSFFFSHLPFSMAISDGLDMICLYIHWNRILSVKVNSLYVLLKEGKRNCSHKAITLI